MGRLKHIGKTLTGSLHRLGHPSVCHDIDVFISEIDGGFNIDPDSGDVFNQLVDFLRKNAFKRSHG
mgnify:CR=1 FL=1